MKTGYEILVWKTLTFVLLGFIVCAVLTAIIFHKILPLETTGKNLPALVSEKSSLGSPRVTMVKTEKTEKVNINTNKEVATVEFSPDPQ